VPPPVPLTPRAAAEVAVAAESVTLRIEAGMHTAVIKRIALTADGRTLATASDDKTVRLWALPEGRLVRVLRPPVGPGDEGKVYAVAIAPDGRWVAAGGWEKSDHVSIFDTHSGAILARLGPLPNVITDLEVSPDGLRLAAGLFGSNGIRVWARSPSPRSAQPVRGEGRGEGQRNTLRPASAPHPDPLPMPKEAWREGDWALAFEDRDYGGEVYGLAFARDGRLAVTSYDGHVRLYDPGGRRVAKVKAPGGARPFGVAVSPDGTRLAVGYEDSTRVDVLDAATLAPLFAADTSGIGNDDLSKVTWLADGRLAAAGRYRQDGRQPIVVWADGGRGPRTAWRGPENTVMDLAPWHGGLAFGAHDPALGLRYAAGAPVLDIGPPMADLRGKVREHFLVSADGRRLRLGLGYGGAHPHLLDLAGPSLAASPTAPADLRPAETRALSIDGWEDGTAPKLTTGGWLSRKTVPLALKPYERARSLAIAPDAGAFVLGTEWYLRRFDATGQELWQHPVPGVVWGVNLARDGRLIVAAYGDGTIRWHRARDGQELLACFVHLPEGPGGPKHWVLWTPAGHYTASPGGHDLVGWHVNRGPDEAAAFYPADTFRRTFEKPDIVAAALDAADR
jgi:WD40 repeat protein